MSLEIHTEHELGLKQLNLYVTLMTRFTYSCDYRLSGKDFEIANSIYFHGDDAEIEYQKF